MLISFKIKNYLSFKNEQELSLIAAPIKEKNIECNENLYQFKNNLKLLRSAVIYGANASGKSNLLKAFEFFKKTILESANVNTGIKNIPLPFVLNISSLNEPSFFEACFLWKGIIYRYGFLIDRNRLIKKEWLFIKKNRETQVFSRENTNVVVLEKYKILKELIDKKMVREDALLLSLGAQFNAPVAVEIFNLLRNFNVISGIEDFLYRNFSINMLDNPDNKNEIIELLKFADIGIQNLNIIEIDSENFNINVDDPETDKMINKRVIPIKRINSEKLILDDNGNVAKKIDMAFEIFESEGTKKLFHLLGPIIDTLHYGKVLIIDELDIKLHPLLTLRIIKLFNCNKTNPGNAQLIFATHDTNLLDVDLFRRDQIWFTEKDKNGATELYSLAEFKIRNDERKRKNYIAGKYGAIPYLGDFDELFERS